MYCDRDLLSKIREVHESHGWIVDPNGVETKDYDYDERQRMSQSESLEDLRKRLVPDHRGSKDGIVRYLDGKEPLPTSDVFYCETMPVVLALEREETDGHQTFYFIKLGVDNIRVMLVSDKRVLLRTEKLWFRPQYHTLDPASWRLIKKYHHMFGYCRVDTDLLYERPYGISADLCNIIPMDVIRGLPTLDQYFEMPDMIQRI